MPSIRDECDDEEFELLELKRSFLDRAFKDLTKASVAKQIAIGGASGTVAGYICSMSFSVAGYMFGKVGKAAAGAIGGSLLILQVAHHQGYIQINWNRVNTNWEKARKKMAKDAHSMIPQLMEETKQFISQNVILAGGFAGGFFLGLAL